MHRTVVTFAPAHMKAGVVVGPPDRWCRRRPHRLLPLRRIGMAMASTKVAARLQRSAVLLAVAFLLAAIPFVALLTALLFALLPLALLALALAFLATLLAILFLLLTALLLLALLVLTLISGLHLRVLLR